MSQIRKFNICPSGEYILENKNTKSDKMIHTAIYINRHTATTRVKYLFLDDWQT